MVWPNAMLHMADVMQDLALRQRAIQRLIRIDVSTNESFLWSYPKTSIPMALFEASPKPTFVYGFPLLKEAREPQLGRVMVNQEGGCAGVLLSEGHVSS
jgi:hypothetical protein